MRAARHRTSAGRALAAPSPPQAARPLRALTAAALRAAIAAPIASAQQIDTYAGVTPDPDERLTLGEDQMSPHVFPGDVRQLRMVGQTFRAPAGQTQLDAFTFLVAPTPPFNAILNPGSAHARACVMAFDDATGLPIGSVLRHSAAPRDGQATYDYGALLAPWTFATGGRTWTTPGAAWRTTTWRRSGATRTWTAGCGAWTHALRLRGSRRLLGVLDRPRAAQRAELRRLGEHLRGGGRRGDVHREWRRCAGGRDARAGHVAAAGGRAARARSGHAEAGGRRAVSARGGRGALAAPRVTP